MNVYRDIAIHQFLSNLLFFCMNILVTGSLQEKKNGKFL